MPQIVTDITIEAYMGISAAQRKYVQLYLGMLRKHVQLMKYFNKDLK